MRKSCVLLALLFLCGCKSKLNVEKTFALKPGEVNSTIIDAISKAQDIKVSAQADADIDVYVFLEADRNDVEKDLNVNKVNTKVIAHKKKTTGAELTANIPANSEAAVTVVSGTKKAEVKLKLTN